MATIKSSAEIDKQIKAIKATGTKLDGMIQQCGLDVLAHLEAHHDITLLNRLYVALPQGARKSAFAEWALKFGACKPNDGANKKEAPFLNDRRATDLVGAATTPWFTFKPEPTVDNMFDLRGKLQAMMKAAAKAEVIVGMTEEQMQALAVLTGSEPLVGKKFAATKAQAAAMAEKPATAPENAVAEAS